MTAYLRDTFRHAGAPLDQLRPAFRLLSDVREEVLENPNFDPLLALALCEELTGACERYLAELKRRLARDFTELPDSEGGEL
jgi:hypothetical protein